METQLIKYLHCNPLAQNTNNNVFVEIHECFYSANSVLIMLIMIPLLQEE